MNGESATPNIFPRIAALAITGTVVFGPMYGPMTASAEDLFAGPATVIDGRTLEVQGQRLRLTGIDAPDLGQPCAWPNKQIDCGNVSRTALLDLVAVGEVRCTATATATAATAVTAVTTGFRPARCQSGGFDVAANMVHTGWAVTAPDGPPGYRATEAKARAGKRGLWKGQFEMPWIWRRRQ